MRALRRVPMPLLAVAFAGGLAQAGAQTTQLTFDAGALGRLPQCYTEAGFSISALPGHPPRARPFPLTCGSLGGINAILVRASHERASSPFLVNPASYITEFTRVDGAAFAFRSLDLAELSAIDGVGNVSFLDVFGFLAGGGTVTERIEFQRLIRPYTPGGGSPFLPQGVFRTFTLPASFTELTAVRLVANPTEHSQITFGYDNLTFTAGPTSVVPEPTTLGLLAGGLAVLGGVMIRRRRPLG